MIKQRVLYENEMSVFLVCIALSKCKNISITDNTFTQSTGEFLGCLLYYSLSRAYSRNIELKDNTLNNVDEEVDGEGE